MGPDQGGQLGPEDPARDRHALGLAHRLPSGGDPVRRLVARLLPDGLVAPGAARRLRVGRVDDPLAPALGVDQLELVLEAGDVRRRRRQLPRLAAARQLVRQPLAELVGEADGREASSRVGELKADFDHGSVSIACQFARRTGLLGRVGPFRTLGGARGRSYHDSSQLSRRNDDSLTDGDERSAQAWSRRRRSSLAGAATGAVLESRLDDNVISACRNKSTGALKVPAAGVGVRRQRAAAAVERPRRLPGHRGRRAWRPIAALRGTACTTVSGLPGVAASSEPKPAASSPSPASRRRPRRRLRTWC